jgi:hypothetical protein
MQERPAELPIAEKPKVHELRIAVVSLSQRALIGSFSYPELFRDIHPLQTNGLIGVSHEQRARTYFNASPLCREVPSLKMLGLLGSVNVPEDETHAAHTISGVAVTTTQKYDFRRFQFARYDLDDLEEYAQKTIKAPETAPIDIIDAQFITKTVKLALSADAR